MINMSEEYLKESLEYEIISLPLFKPEKPHKRFIKEEVVRFSCN